MFTFSGGFAESQQRQQENHDRQARENEEYHRRVREFGQFHNTSPYFCVITDDLLTYTEAEIAAEEKAKAAKAAEVSQNAKKLADAQTRAFKAGREGRGNDMRTLIETYDLDVMYPETAPRGQFVRPRGAPASKDAGKLPKRYDTMLHAAAGKCGLDTIIFLLARGMYSLPCSSDFFSSIFTLREPRRRPILP